MYERHADTQRNSGEANQDVINIKVGGASRAWPEVAESRDAEVGIAKESGEPKRCFSLYTSVRAFNPPASLASVQEISVLHVALQCKLKRPDIKAGSVYPLVAVLGASSSRGC